MTANIVTPREGKPVTEQGRVGFVSLGCPKNTVD
jgi:hypothetical protein